MWRDPLYVKIVERLGGRLDPELFQQCAVDLLRREWPGLVPIGDGADGGMDGAVPDGMGEPFPLVCTVGKNVIGNLTRNLQSYAASGGTRRKARVAPLRAPSPHAAWAPRCRDGIVAWSAGCAPRPSWSRSAQCWARSGRSFRSRTLLQDLFLAALLQPE